MTIPRNVQPITGDDPCPALGSQVAALSAFLVEERQNGLTGLYLMPKANKDMTFDDMARDTLAMLEANKRGEFEELCHITPDDDK